MHKEIRPRIATLTTILSLEELIEITPGANSYAPVIDNIVALFKDRYIDLYRNGVMSTTTTTTTTPPPPPPPPRANTAILTTIPTTALPPLEL